MLEKIKRHFFKTNTERPRRLDAMLDLMPDKTKIHVGSGGDLSSKFGIIFKFGRSTDNGESASPLIAIVFIKFD